MTDTPAIAASDKPPEKAAVSPIAEFCSNSSIHGVRYFSERRLHWSERVWWIIAFGLSVAACGHSMFKVMVKLNQSPVIVSYDGSSTPVWQIPFPAVTICPETKSYKHKFDFTDVLHKLTENSSEVTKDSLQRMEVVMQLCDYQVTEDNVDIGTNFTNSTFFDVLKDVALDFSDTMFFCKWRNDANFCNAFFRTTLTEEGVCYTFNALNSRDIYTDEMAPDMMTVTENPNATFWSLEDGYDHSSNGNFTDETYPYRVFGAGAWNGLFVLLRLYEQDLEYICRGPVQGFKMLLHNPGEVPQVSRNYFHVPLLQEVLISVKPNMKDTSADLRHFTPFQRKCYFGSERKLRFFKVYTQRNCELECLSNFTRIQCGCVKFSLPRDRDTLICGSQKIKCYKDAEYKVLQKLSADDLYDGAECNCLPSCVSLTYDAEVSQAKFDWISLFTAYKNPLDEFPGMQPARLAIFFKENRFEALHRFVTELYGFTDFLANFGGLLGVFLGISFLNIIEFVYYFTLRHCLRRHRQRKSLPMQKNQIRPLHQSIPNVKIVECTNTTTEGEKDHLN